MSKILMPCVILSGGRSSRMGQLKQNLEFFDSTLADFMAENFTQCFQNVYFSAKTPIQNRFGVSTILDSVGRGNDLSLKENFAPIFGLQSILEFLQCDVFVLSIDAPCFNCTSAQKILSTYQKNKKPIFAKNSKIHPLLGIYPFNTLATIQKQIIKKDYKLTHLLKQIQAEFIEINEEKTQNLNTYQDYQDFIKNIGVING